MDWTEKEVELIIIEYFKMLHLESEYKKYNKTLVRRALLPLLNGRSNGAVEFKLQNISAILAMMGQPYIKGYKPRRHIQDLLKIEVAKYLEKNKVQIERDFTNFCNQNILPSKDEHWNFENFLDPEPAKFEFNEDEPKYQPIKINYLEREQNNRSLGEAGEKLVIDYERYRLIKAGKKNLADKIEWVSKEVGDGTGYDILSKNENGSDRFIEVKTTKLLKETPIYLTHKELAFSSIKGEEFYLYRVYNFGLKPQFFMMQGNYANYCTLQPITFRGFFNSI